MTDTTETLIPTLTMPDCRAAARYVQHLAARDAWTPDRTAGQIADLAIEAVQDAAREGAMDALGLTDDPYDRPEVDALDRRVARALDDARAFLIEELAAHLGPHGRGWRDSAPGTYPKPTPPAGGWPWTRYPAMTLRPGYREP